MTGPLLELALALALTVAIELGVVALLGVRAAREFAAVALVNLVTNPALNVALLALRGDVLPALAPGAATIAEWAFIVVAEAAIVLVEWRLLVWALRADSRTWLARSIAMNAASFVFGSALLAALVRPLGL